jgi:hypothetical protein
LLEIEAMAVDEPRKTAVRAHKETMLLLNMESRRLVAEIVKDGLEHLRGLPKAELAKRHQALKNFVTIADCLFGWRALAEIESQAAQELARREAGIRSTTGIINLELIHTSPEQLKRLSMVARAEGACDENHREITRPAPVRAQSGFQVPKDLLARKERRQATRSLALLNRAALATAP